MKKLLIGLSLFISLTLVPTVASAQTVESLQAQINALIAQLNQLKGAQGTTVPVPTPTPTTTGTGQGDVAPSG